jgi:hypothetical protein
METIPELESVRFRHGGDVPSYWKPCPVCGGDSRGCGDCDGRGVVPPYQCDQLDEKLSEFEEYIWVLEEEWLAHERVPRRTRRLHEWRAVQAEVARRLLARWAAEDGHPDDLMPDRAATKAA